MRWIRCKWFYKSFHSKMVQADPLAVHRFWWLAKRAQVPTLEKVKKKIRHVSTVWILDLSGIQIPIVVTLINITFTNRKRVKKTRVEILSGAKERKTTVGIWILDIWIADKSKLSGVWMSSIWMVVHHSDAIQIPDQYLNGFLNSRNFNSWSFHHLTLVHDLNIGLVR